MEKLITLPMVTILVGAILMGVGGFWATLRANREKIQAGNERKELLTQNNNLTQQSKLQTEKIQSLEKLTVDFKIIGPLMPGNEPDPTITVQKKPPEDAIKLYIGSCLAWWKPSVSRTTSIESGRIQK